MNSAINTQVVREATETKGDAQGERSQEAKEPAPMTVAGTQKILHKYLLHKLTNEWMGML